MGATVLNLNIMDWGTIALTTLKEASTEALNQLIDYPACNIILAAGKGFIEAE